MPIKYGEITCIINENFLNKIIFRSWFNFELIDHTNSKIVILFEDGEICEINDKLIDCEYTFLDDYLSETPIHFSKKITAENVYKKIYFKQDLAMVNGEKKLRTHNLFKFHPQYLSQSRTQSHPSVFNSIYYCHTINKNIETNNLETNRLEVFGLLHLKSSEHSPRFIFAYDSDEFSKEEVVYILNSIFKKNRMLI